MKSSPLRVALITAALIASFLAGSWLAPRIRITWEAGPIDHLAEAKPADKATAGKATEEPIARAVAKVAPTVVNIDTVRRVIREDWFLGPRVYESQGAGSGVVIDARGYALTNEHVVAGASEIFVTFGNGKQYRGRVVGKDAETDIGLIQIQGAGTLPVAVQGDSRKLVPGQWAIAIGNPYGFQQTVTLGVIGHSGRAINVGERVYKSLIQTDAAINPGNSGGPLCDIQGRVIGINTVVQRDAQGIGFAIPIHLARSIADELIRHGKIKRPWTGLNVINVTPDIAAYLGLQRAQGAVVDKIDRRGPAWAAGVRPGDVIRELDGQQVESRDAVEAIIGKAKIGDRLKIVVEREGERLRGEIQVAEKP